VPSSDDWTESPRGSEVVVGELNAKELGSDRSLPSFVDTPKIVLLDLSILDDVTQNVIIEHSKCLVIILTTVSASLVEELHSAGWEDVDCSAFAASGRNRGV
jgi:hypothetical protein